MRRRVTCVVLVALFAGFVGIPGCFRPDLSGFPCSSDQDCAGLSCTLGVCGGSERVHFEGHPPIEAPPDGIAPPPDADAAVDEPTVGVEPGQEQTSEPTKDTAEPAGGDASEPPQERSTEPTSENPADGGEASSEKAPDVVPDGSTHETTPEKPSESVPEPRPEPQPEPRTEPRPTTCQNDGERRRCLPSRGCTMDSSGRVTCKGICQAGFETCMGGKWGPCAGTTEPAAKEACNRRDDDCDGQTDEFVLCSDPAHVCINGVCKKDPAGTGGNYTQCFDDNSCKAGKICFDVSGTSLPYKVCLPKCDSVGKCPGGWLCAGPRGSSYNANKPNNVACFNGCQVQTHCATEISNWRDYKCGGVRQKPPGWNVSVSSCVKN